MRALLEIQINLICLSPASGIGRVANVRGPRDSRRSEFRARVEVIGTLLTSPPPPHPPTTTIKVHVAVSYISSTVPEI